MNIQKFMDCERERLEKYSKLQLPNKFKTVGVIVLIASISTLIGLRFVEGEPEILRDIIEKSILVGLLLISVSRDKEEDELTVKLRSQSYAMAFIFGVFYALTQPYVTYAIVRIFNKENKESLLQLGDFQLLFFMLLIQIMFYQMLKRFR
ncbi:MAG: hypothetical protein GXO84_02735 [Chlorobi bacterium]|nr:hypothetical protein [Chlorobiota bacterium]